MSAIVLRVHGLVQSRTLHWEKISNIRSSTLQRCRPGQGNGKCVVVIARVQKGESFFHHSWARDCPPIAARSAFAAVVHLNRLSQRLSSLVDVAPSSLRASEKTKQRPANADAGSNGRTPWTPSRSKLAHSHSCCRKTNHNNLSSQPSLILCMKNNVCHAAPPASHSLRVSHLGGFAARCARYVVGLFKPFAAATFHTLQVSFVEEQI